MTIEKITAGQKSLQASQDETKYDLLEVAEAMAKDVLEQVWICIDNHYNKINEKEFCIVLLRAKDPLITNLVRKKFYAYPFLPKPRPEQSVFHYDKTTDTVCRLWSLPAAKTMAVISEMQYVAPAWQKTKEWADAFFDGRFYEFIRKQNGINLESEEEYLELNREKLIKSGCKEVSSPLSDPFDFSKVTNGQITNPIDPLFFQKSLKASSKTKTLNRNVSA